MRRWRGPDTFTSAAISQTSTIHARCPQCDAARDMTTARTVSVAELEDKTHSSSSRRQSATPHPPTRSLAAIFV